MASRALSAKFRSAASSWLGSTTAEPHIAAQIGHHADPPAERRGAEQRHQVGDQLIDVGRPDRQPPPARKGQQPAGQLRTARDRPGGALQPRALLGLLLGDGSGYQVQATLDRRQKIVEVVRNAAGELSHRLQFLRLQQRRLGFLALGDFHLQPVVRGQQIPRPLGNTRFQQIRSSPEAAPVASAALPPFRSRRRQSGRTRIAHHDPALAPKDGPPANAARPRPAIGSGDR